MSRRRVAVIGAGPSGICAVKTLLEDGLEPICFERTNHIGGLWRYHDDDIDGLASVMKTTIINTSKEMSAISDFPPADDAPNYMHNKEVHHYLVQYATKFGVNKYVNFNKEVIEINMADDYDATGCLTVTVKDTKDGQISKDIYDGVMVCIGHHVYPNMPSFPGMDIFKGKIMHTHSLKNVQSFNDQVVVIVGTGNSGMDAAVEICSVAKQVHLSTRRGTWVIPRIGAYGIPFDLLYTRRIFDFIYQHVPYSLSCWFVERILNQRFDHDKYNIKPAHRVLSQHPTMSDGLPIKLLSGVVKMKKNIKEFVESGVIFEGENQVTECDAVVFATGYQIKFPFLNERLTTVKNNQPHLYKYMFPSHLKYPSLAIIGLIQSVGAGFPCGESQLRWATLIFNGKLSLPSPEEMELDIIKKKKMNEKRYTKSKRHTIQVDYIDYLDEINSLFGAKPNYLKMFFRDPALFWTLFLGPSLPYQYRLEGPHSWPGARKAIMNSKKRLFKPLKEDYIAKPKNIIKKKFFIFFIVFVAVLLSYFQVFV
ncbi:flavin-containing monooxygenase 5 [Parasteatoda tepidariorum]|uniref:flavin-containing monooxygenase 5 n=1 Tax=Parasteatoda tepidariorum TaxID=114398 RepID=UPI001C71D5A3|nr:flavin-containing monooxygenase 5 [Parasteatoda tepidariorum]